jgi:hypothetical protein
MVQVLVQDLQGECMLITREPEQCPVFTTVCLESNMDNSAIELHGFYLLDDKDIRKPNK